MKTALIGILLFIATYLHIAGPVDIPKINLKKRTKLKFHRARQANSDQEFLEYLWDLKSEISSGAVISRTDLQIPKNILTNQLQLILKLSNETGAPLTPTLNRFIKQVKNQIELKQEINSELASTKATVSILSALPILGILLSSLLGANSINWLFGSNMGRVCLALGIGLNALGIFWVKQIVRRSLQS